MKRRKDSTEKTIRDIRRATRKRYSPEEKIRIVLEGLRGEDSIAELCRREGINSTVGQKSLWRLARNACQVTRFVKPPPMKSKPYAQKQSR